jgi:hypothetical protein
MILEREKNALKIEEGDEFFMRKKNSSSSVKE